MNKYVNCIWALYASEGNIWGQNYHMFVSLQNCGNSSDVMDKQLLHNDENSFFKIIVFVLFFLDDFWQNKISFNIVYLGLMKGKTI